MDWHSEAGAGLAGDGGKDMKKWKGPTPTEYGSGHPTKSPQSLGEAFAQGVHVGYELAMNSDTVWTLYHYLSADVRFVGGTGYVTDLVQAREVLAAYEKDLVDV